MRFGLGLGNGLGLRNQVAFGGSIPFKSDLNLHAKGRVGLTIPDEKGNNISILPSCGSINQTNYATLSINDFEIGDASGFVEAYFFWDGTNGNHTIFSTGNTVTENRSLTFLLSNKYVYCSVKSITGVTFARQVTPLVNAGFYKVKISSNGFAYFIHINDVLQTTGLAGGTNNGKWLSSIEGRTNITIGIAINTAFTQSTSSFKLIWVNYNNKHLWTLFGIGNKIYDTIGSDHLTWVGTSHVSFDAVADQSMLNIGYSVWTKQGSLDEYVPYKDGLPYDVSSYLTGYIKLKDVDGDSLNHNLAPSKINILQSNWDRSNLSICSPLARSGYYDASLPNSYYIDELNAETLTTFFNIGYRGLCFVKAQENSISNRLKLLELIGYTTNKSGYEIDSVYRYTKDSGLFIDKFDELLENSLVLSDETTYKERIPFGRFGFTYSGTIIKVKANPTIYATFPQYAEISVFVNGVFNQSVPVVANNYVTITLPAGLNKNIELVEGLVSKPATEYIGTFITSVLTDSTFIKKSVDIATEKLLFIGDSITAGGNTTIPAIQCYTNLFRIDNSKNVSTYAYGYGRLMDLASTTPLINATVANILTLFSGATDKKLLIMLGTNDAGLDSTISTTFISWYSALLDAIHAADSSIKVYCISPILRNDAVEASLLIAYRAAMVTMCSTRAYSSYINGLTILTYPADYADNVHPNIAGHAKIKAAINSIMYP